MLRTVYRSHRLDRNCVLTKYFLVFTIPQRCFFFTMRFDLWEKMSRKEIATTILKILSSKKMGIPLNSKPVTVASRFYRIFSECGSDPLQTFT